MFRLIKNSDFRAFIVFCLITFFYFKPMLMGIYPIPLDIMAGGYLPWNDYKWGYEVGVPIKNASLSDIFSTVYPWRILAVEQMKQGLWPLWNPYSFSGTPLLANWQSAPLYPLNVLIPLFGNLLGWSLIIVMQIFLSQIFMYFYLRSLNLKSLSAIAGAVIFAFGSFMTLYLEYATAGQGFMWTPLILLCIEKYISKQKLLFLSVIPFLVFLSATAGSFQAFFYTLIIVSVYFIFRILQTDKNNEKRIKAFLSGGIFAALGISLSAIQLLPTIELLQNSIRFGDQNVKEYNFGILPIKNLITFLSPDFFGNPSTQNFWGVIGYQETAVYVSIFAVVLFITLALNFRRLLSIERFFIILTLITLVLIFANPLSKLVYQLHTPILSTSYATRMLLLTTLGFSVITAFSLEKITQFKKDTLRSTLIVFLSLLAVEAFIFIVLNTTSDIALKNNLLVGVKNTILPTGFLLVLLISIRFIKNQHLLKLILCILIIVDILRFSLKFTPFSPVKLDYPTTPTIEFLKQNSGIYRVERERTEVFPLNTLAAYKFLTTSGYDPLYYKDYAMFYKLVNGGDLDGKFTRYVELEDYNSHLLNLLGVKYLAVAKRDSFGKIDQKSASISAQVENIKYKQVYSDHSTVILENNQVLDRVLFFDKYIYEPEAIRALEKLKKIDNFQSQVVGDKQIVDKLSKKQTAYKIKEYKSSKVTLDIKTTGSSVLVLTDAYYPGWKVKVDGKTQDIIRADGIFKGVYLPEGNHVVEFFYDPRSFKVGLVATLISAGLSFIIFIYLKVKKI